MAVRGRDIDGVGDDGRGRPAGRAITKRQWREAGFPHYADEQIESDAQKAAARASGGGGGGARAGAWRLPWYYGAAMLLFGVPFWPVSAWFLASGWREIVNAILVFVHLPWAIPAVSGVYGIVAAIIVGGIYSRVELRPPLGARDWRAAALAWAAWLAVMISDVGATYRGVDRASIIGLIAALLLTFGPDQAIMRGWRILRGKAPF